MITGIILAAGFSRRMQRDKLTLEFGGIPILARVLNAVTASNVDEIIMVYRDSTIKEIGVRYGIKLVYNPRAVCGQSESMKLGIQAASAETAGLMFFVGDQPFLDPVTINRLIEVFNEGNSLIVVPAYRGKRGTPVIFAAALKDALLQIKGDTGGRELITQRPHEVTIVDFINTAVGMDVDTWVDYEKWR